MLYRLLGNQSQIEWGIAIPQPQTLVSLAQGDVHPEGNFSVSAINAPYEHISNPSIHVCRISQLFGPSHQNK